MTDSNLIELASHITLTDIEAVYAQIVEALDMSNEININAEAVEKIDTAGLQLLCLAKQDVDSNLGEFKWINPSEKLIASARLLGVKELLDL